MDHLSNKWTLESLTIGPQVHETNTKFWEESFKDFPPLPGVDNVTIICNYPSAKSFNTDCWKYFDHLLTRCDLFPALESVDIQSSFGSQQLSPRRWSDITASLRGISRRGLWPRRPPNIYRGFFRSAARAFVPGQGKFLTFNQ